MFLFRISVHRCRRRNPTSESSGQQSGHGRLRFGTRRIGNTRIDSTSADEHTTAINRSTQGSNMDYFCLVYTATVNSKFKKKINNTVPTCTEI